MKKKIFITKNNNKYYIILFFTILLVFIYFILYLINTNQKYFIISNQDENIFYIIPKDKEGEKVKFINKKSVNNLSLSKTNINNINIEDLNYTIQLFSDITYDPIVDYINRVINPRSEIISLNELFIFSINSEIGTDYFVTYGNFYSKSEAQNYCHKLTFIKKCLILNPQN